MNYAPIVVFAFNRPDSLKNTVASLLTNSEAAESDLIVFVDGPHESKAGEAQKVCAVMEFVKGITGFKSVTYHFSEKNKGLGPSIIAGVTEVINEFGRVIVLEDDLIVQPNFLAFINQGLAHYELDDTVWSVCGYSNKVKTPQNYSADAYFCPRSSSWGWATWADRWNSVDWDLNDWSEVEANGKGFNKWGGSDCYSMLKGWHDGQNKSWAIRFCYAQFVQDKLSLFPVKSKIINDGFDGQGTNCKKWSRFKCETDNSGKKNFVMPASTVVNKVLRKQALLYHSLLLRAYSKIMYIIDYES